MEEIKLLNDDVIEQIKDFDYIFLTEEEESLIDKLISDEELKNYYKTYGLCEECGQPKDSHHWCRVCTNERFQRNFKNWTSGNDDIDKFIQNAQLKVRQDAEIIEWIEIDRFEDIKYLARGGFGTVYEAIWKDGSIEEFSPKNNQWKRFGEEKVALKCLHDSQNITAEFLREVRYFL